MATAADTFKRAVQCFQQGRLEEAERHFRQVLHKEPRHLASLNILAIILTTLKKYAEAEPHLQTALRLQPRSDATLYNYGVVLKALGRPEEALLRFTEALAINPSNAETWNNRGTVRHDLGDHALAIADFDRSISLDPRYAAAFFNKSRSLGELKRYDEALAACDKALELKPDFAEAWYGRGFVFSQLRRPNEAAAAYRQALAINYRIPLLKGNLLHQKMLACDWSETDRLIAEINTDLASGQLSAEPFGWQGVATSQRSLLQCAQLYCASRFPANFTTPAAPRPRLNGKIRIGYLSGEFRQQATSLLLVGVLEQHDRERFEIFAIDNGGDDHSETRRRIVASVHQLIGIRDVNDPDAAAAIRAAGIDILVNLNGYFGDARTRVFARRAAPIQANYLGFPGTMGAPYMDYIIADRHVLPPSHHPFYTEKVVTLPNCYQANDRNRAIAARSFSRAELGLPAEAVVFCCFNNAYKVTPEVFDAWMRILRGSEGSVLWLLEDSVEAVANLRREATARGVDADRLVFAGRLPPPEHLARHRYADLFLDTSPYGAHTTASDALWAGLPVLTRLGETFAGRVCASLLYNLNLPELVTLTREEYVEMAIDLARQPERRKAIRQKLADNRLTAPLFDTVLFARHIEAGYAAMIERHNAGLPPDHIVVPA
jgi:predicted O-linked N-acetylglucosamine transferase (SPINDLY family)